MFHYWPNRYLVHFLAVFLVLIQDWKIVVAKDQHFGLDPPMVVVPMVVPKFFQWLGPKVPMEPRAFSFHIPMDFSVCTCKLEFHWRTSMDSWFQCSREFFFEFEWLVCDAKTYLGINQRVDQIRNFFCFLASSEFSHCLCFFQWMDPKECMVLAWKKIRIIIYLKNLFFLISLTLHFFSFFHNMDFADVFYGHKWLLSMVDTCFCKAQFHNFHGFFRIFGIFGNFVDFL